MGVESDFGPSQTPAASNNATQVIVQVSFPPNLVPREKRPGDEVAFHPDTFPLTRLFTSTESWNCNQSQKWLLTLTKPGTISSSSQVAFQRLAALRFSWKILNILKGIGMFSAKSSAWSRTVIKPRLVDAEVTSGPKVPSRNKSWLHKSLAQKSLGSSSADEEFNEFWVKTLSSQDVQDLSTESEGGKSLKSNLWGAWDGDRLCKSFNGANYLWHLRNRLKENLHTKKQ